MSPRERGLAGAVVAIAISSICVWTFGGEPPTTLSEREKGAIVQKITTEIMHGQLLYNLAPMKRPSVSFAPRETGNAAESMCEYRLVSEGTPAWSVWVNERLAATHYRRFMRETVPHEVAHLLSCQMRNPIWDMHTPEWETIVRDMGAKPVPQHDYAEVE